MAGLHNLSEKHDVRVEGSAGAWRAFRVRHTRANRKIRIQSGRLLRVVLGGGLEPPRVAPPAPQAGVSANFTTRAFHRTAYEIAAGDSTGFFSPALAFEKWPERMTYRQNIRFSLRPKVARLERFELPTLWSEARCSVQLSYRRIRKALCRAAGTRAAQTLFRPHEVVNPAGPGCSTDLRALEPPSQARRAKREHPATGLALLNGGSFATLGTRFLRLRNGRIAQPVGRTRRSCAMHFECAWTKASGEKDAVHQTQGIGLSAAFAVIRRRAGGPRI